MTRLLKLFLLSLVLCCTLAWGIERFPPPDFEGGYTFPTTTTPGPDAPWHEWLDVGVLIAALSVGTYLVLKKRSRAWVFGLMVFSLAYFGFYRKGCVCSIGAIQNVALTVFSSDYAIPLTALLFFVIPLVFTLFFGRIFCGSVCPLGAIQDLVLMKPMAVPKWLEAGLRMIAYTYLALSVLFAATGSAFLICRYDPFVAFFRLSGNMPVFVLGACFLVIGLFVARPYCRFVCPYGVLLRQCSRLSKWRVTITPTDCIACRLCEDACPFGAIDGPQPEWTPRDHAQGRRRLTTLLVALPVFVLLGAEWGTWLHLDCRRCIQLCRWLSACCSKHRPMSLTPRIRATHSERQVKHPRVSMEKPSRFNLCIVWAVVSSARFWVWWQGSSLCVSRYARNDLAMKRIRQDAWPVPAAIKPVRSREFNLNRIRH